MTVTVPDSYKVNDRRGVEDEEEEGKRSRTGLTLSAAGAREAQTTAYAFKSVDEAFPPVDPEHIPLYSQVLIQVRTPAKMTAGGIALTEDTRETEYWNTQVGRVRAMGPLCFKNRDTGEPWPEGRAFELGDFVRVPKYGGDRFEVDVEGSKDKAIFVIFQEADIRARLTGDPLKYIAYIR